MRIEDQMDALYRKRAPQEWREGYVPPGGYERLAERGKEVPFEEELEYVKYTVKHLWVWALVAALVFHLVDARLEVDELRRELGRPEKYGSREID